MILLEDQVKLMSVSFESKSTAEIARDARVVFGAARSVFRGVGVSRL